MMTSGDNDHGDELISGEGGELMIMTCIEKNDDDEW